MDKILYLPIETIARELDAKLLLAHRALSRGYSVVIGQKNNVLKAAERLGYGIYFYKSHELSNFPKSYDLNESNFIYTALDEEGLVFLDDKSYLGRAKPHKLEHLRIVFTWGKYQRNLLVKENPSLESKTIPVGNPRFDLLRPEFLPIYSSVQEKLCKTWGRYVLVNTNFGPGNFSRHYGCKYLEYMEHSFIKNRGRPLFKHERLFFIEREKYYKELFNLYKEMLVILSSKFPYLNFILRPHPSEDHENWGEALKWLKNVYVIFEGSSVDWIQGALAIVHTGCTTGIESWALRKPVIAYNPNSKTVFESELPNKFGLCVKNLNELFGILENVITGKFQNTFDEQVETAHLFIESIKGKLSAERIMNALDSLPDDQQAASERIEKSIYLKLRGMESIKSAWKIQLLKWMRKYQRIINTLTRKKIATYIDNRFQKYPGLISQFQKFPGLRAKYICQRLSVFNVIFQKEHAENYLVRKIATDTYIIEKK